jgi:hypothetical protein
MIGAGDYVSQADVALIEVVLEFHTQKFSKKKGAHRWTPLPS